jgi:hypothetical protein
MGCNLGRGKSARVRSGCGWRKRRRDSLSRSPSCSRLRPPFLSTDPPSFTTPRPRELPLHLQHLPVTLGLRRRAGAASSRRLLPSVLPALFRTTRLRSRRSPPRVISPAQVSLRPHQSRPGALFVHLFICLFGWTSGGSVWGWILGYWIRLCGGG